MFHVASPWRNERQRGETLGIETNPAQPYISRASLMPLKITFKSFGSPRCQPAGLGDQNWKVEKILSLSIKISQWKGGEGKLNKVWFSQLPENASYAWWFQYPFMRKICFYCTEIISFQIYYVSKIKAKIFSSLCNSK